MVVEDREFREGEYVLLYMDERRRWIVKLEKGKKFHTHKGIVDLDRVIGKLPGITLKTTLGTTVYVLRPSLTDFLLKISRKTQIIYPKDMAVITALADITPGSFVVEGGTGSGALACFLASRVMPTGKVVSYEVREDVQRIAEKNIKRLGLEQYIELKLRDLTEGIEERNVDAVVLDMPVPWRVVPHAKAALKHGGFFASFSPTINQVEKTVKKLQEERFVDVRALEVMVREYKVKEGETRPHTRMIGHTGFIVVARRA